MRVPGETKAGWFETGQTYGPGLWFLWGLWVLVLAMVVGLCGFHWLSSHGGFRVGLSTPAVIHKGPMAAVFYTLRLFLFVGFGVWLVWHRPRDRMVLLLTLGFFGLGAIGMSNTVLLMPGEQGALRFWRVVAALCLMISVMSFFLTPLLFPDGRFVPAWSRFLLPLSWGVVVVYVVSFWWAGRVPVRLMGVMILLLLSMQGFQVSRYRKHATHEQKQQIKWCLFGTIWALILQLLVLLIFRGGLLSQATALLPWMFHILVLSSYVVFLLAFSMAVIRFGLWEIDTVINRSIVLGLLVVVLMALFGAGFWLLRWVLQALFGAEQAVLAAVLATIPVTIAFQPTFQRLRRFIDARFYGIHIDYQALQPTLAMASRAQSGQGESLGRFVQLSVLGSGGMGEVYLVREKQSGKLLALKMLRKDDDADEQMTRRFLREAQILQSLEHPGIVSLVEFGEQKGSLFMAMEYIKGEGLESLIKRHGRFSLASLRPMLEGLAEAIDYAHSEGVIHRDIKPGNIMLVRREEASAGGEPLDAYERVVLMDFGIARLLAPVTALTHADMVMGTAQFIAPEQIRDARLVDGRADVYALGVTVYLLLTGKFPFAREHLFSMMLAHLSQPVPDPRLFVPDLPERVVEAVLKSMTKAPEDRFATAQAFIQALYVESPKK